MRGGDAEKWGGVACIDAEECDGVNCDDAEV